MKILLIGEVTGNNGPTNVLAIRYGRYILKVKSLSYLRLFSRALRAM